MYWRKNKQTNLSDYVGPNLDTAGCQYNLKVRRVNIPVVQGEVVKQQPFQKIVHVGTVRVAPGYHQAAPNTRTTPDISLTTPRKPLNSTITGVNTETPAGRLIEARTPTSIRPHRGPHQQDPMTQPLNCSAKTHR